MKSKLKLMVIGLCLFILAGCDNSVAKADRTIELMQDEITLIVNELNSVQDLEDELQTDFEQMIAQDASMKNFYSDDHAVQKNINQRSEHLKQADDHRQALVDLIDELDNLSNNQQMPTDDFTRINQLITDLDKSLKLYLTDYLAALPLEEQSFKSLSNPQVDYDHFFSVLDNINKLFTTNQINLNKVLQYFEPLNISLINTKVYLVNLQDEK